jgi:hypothetical protein
VLRRLSSENPDAERVGQQGSTEQVVESGFLERGPLGLAGQRVGGQDEAQAVLIVQGAQRSGGGLIDRFLLDHVVDVLSRDRAAIM